jgi:hypothetical protein
MGRVVGRHHMNRVSGLLLVGIIGEESFLYRFETCGELVGAVGETRAWVSREND